MNRCVVEGSQVGENGINYGEWTQFVDACSEDEAKAEAVRIVKGQGGPTAHQCYATHAELLT